MSTPTSTTFSMFAALVALLLCATASAQNTGFTQSYCSTQNTGNGDAFTDSWQTNGLCSDHCNALGTYAFAVVQYRDCWCSNYIPSTQADMGGCQKNCPGFPSEKCGDEDKGLYIYIELVGKPSGTAGGASQPSSTDSSSVNRPSSTLRTAVTSSATQLSTSVQVITESGAIVTRTVIFQPSQEASQAQPTSKSSSNTGAIIGGVVGGVAALAAIVGGILFFLWRKKKQQRADHEHQTSITRNTSTMSKAGLIGGRNAATDSHYPPPITTNISASGSRHDNESISPISGSQRRYSQPMMIDSRLNPETVLMYHPTFGNASRESIGSIDDSRDYGRQLNVRNPDPH